MTNFNNSIHDSRNNLTLGRYIIDEALHFSLESGELRNSENLLNINKFYLVMIRVLNKDSKVLVYNYISYPYIFYYTFLAFIATRNKYGGINNHVHRQAGDFLSIFEDRLNIGDVKDKLSLSKDTMNIENIIGNIHRYPYTLTNVEVFKLINRLILLVNVDNMSYLTSLALDKEYKVFVKEVLSTLDDYRSLVKDLDNEVNIKPLSIINGCLFVVEDIKKLVESIRKYNYNINTGPQPLRGQVNSINNSLSILDMEYRKSLYNHNNYHVIKGNLYSGLKLNRDKFSFNNIHMNLGGIKWYSTKINVKSLGTLKSQYILKPVKRNLKSQDTLKSTKTLLDKKYNQLKDESYIFTQLGEYLKSLPVNEDTETTIENFLLNYSSILYNKKLDKQKSMPVNYNLISNKFTKLLTSKESTIDDFLNNIRDRVYTKKPVRKSEVSLYYLHNILKVVDNSFVKSIINGRLLRIINVNNQLHNLESNLSLELGSDLVKHYHYSLYIKELKLKLKLSDSSNINKTSVKYNLNYTLSDWKRENENIINEYNYKNDEFIGYLGSVLVKWMLDLELVNLKWVKIGKKESRNILIPTTEVVSTLKNINNMVHLPRKMPMIVKPKPYYRYKDSSDGIVKERLGGYLLNDHKYTEELIIPKWNLKIPSEIKDKNVVYDLVNNINSVGYKINKDVLDFIINNNEKYNFISSDNYEDLISKSKLSPSDYRKLESMLSNKGLQENILGLAIAYSNIHEFYLPVRLDYRGRLYCTSEYLNYQSNELAKSLILFSKPEYISKIDSTALNYLKAYGANCYGNKLDKKSWNDRIKWVDDNLYNIINFRKGELINKSGNKLLFIAFCFEYNRYLECVNNNEVTYFETYLPVRLDATCNGYQHLALLSMDNNLAKELNLTKSSWDDVPKDFYSFIGINLISWYKTQLKSNITEEDRGSYIRLIGINILRAILKRAVMTKAYNISPLEMIRKIQENFECCVGQEYIPDDTNQSLDVEINYSEKYLNTWYQFKDDKSIKLKFRDFKLIRLGLEVILNNDSFKLKKLMNYLNEIAKILTSLNLYIPWGSPSGVYIRQSFITEKEIRLKPFAHSKRTFTLCIPDKGERYNKKKQIRGFMPNLVHSLDAASLALLVDLYFNSSMSKDALNNEKTKNIFSVHDCFGVTANNIETILNLLKYVYIKIYSESHYLRELDKGIISFIKFTYGEQSIDDITREINIDVLDSKFKYFPSIEGVLGTDSNSAALILASSYIAH
jgi:hypothetical protein